MNPSIAHNHLSCPRCGRIVNGVELGAFCEADGAAFVPDFVLKQNPTDPFLGTTIAKRYAIVDVLGSGAMGAVYRAIQAPINREVALKVIHPGIQETSQLRRRFFREARSVAELDGPHTVRLFDYGEDPDLNILYMVLELVRGQTLKEFLKTRGALPFYEAVDLTCQALDALAEIHAKGLVHRDLKPANLMLAAQVDGSWHLKVLDFGIAKPVRRDTLESTLTADGATPGTPAYNAPEQIQGRRLGPPSDLYAISVMLFEMLAGQRPYHGVDREEMRDKHLMAPVPKLPAHVDAPKALAKIVRQGLAKKSKARPQTALEMREMLQAAIPLQGSSALIQATTPAPKSYPESALTPQARPLIGARLAVVALPAALLLMGLIAVLVSRESNPHDGVDDASVFKLSRFTQSPPDVSPPQNSPLASISQTDPAATMAKDASPSAADRGRTSVATDAGAKSALSDVRQPLRGPRSVRARKTGRSARKRDATPASASELKPVKMVEKTADAGYIFGEPVKARSRI